jgi:DSF synthase
MQGGELYPAEVLHDMGLIDILAEPGEGRQEVFSFIRKQKRAWNGHVNIQRVFSKNRLFDYESLVETANIWVDAAMSVSDRDIRKMQKLVAAQYRLARTAEPEELRQPFIA